MEAPLSGEPIGMDELHTLASDWSDVDPNIAPPAPDQAMYYGLVGEAGRIAANETEVNPVAAMAGFLSFLGANVGRDVYLAIGNTYHHPRIFTLHVGRSGRGRKGDALSLTQRIRTRMEETWAGTLGQCHAGGLSTREGLALLIHDGLKQGKEDIPPIDDKRLWVVESEFANVLHQSRRDGNTLSAALRDAWDGVSIRPAIKSSRVWATRPHIGIHACVTPSELLSLIESRDLSNGFANRFLMIWAERTRIVPFPQPTPKAVLDRLAERTAAVVRFAKGGYPGTESSREMHLSDAASLLYAEAYRKELTRTESADLLTSLLERQAPYVLRLATLFALTDQALLIQEHHINAALAWVRYARQSVRFIFGEAAQVAEGEQKADTARKILEFLRDRPDGADRTALINECFQRRGSASRIDEALSSLLLAVPPRIELIEQPRKDGRTGRPRKIYRIIPKCGCGISGISGDRPIMPDSLTPHDCGISGVSFSDTADSDLTPQTPQRCGISESDTTDLTPLIPQTPHGHIKKSTSDLSEKSGKPSSRIVEGAL
jgi:hypothetical protein